MQPAELSHPASAFRMIERHELVIRPVEMVGEHGYLLVELIEGVAGDSPSGCGSTSNRCSQ